MKFSDKKKQTKNTRHFLILTWQLWGTCHTFRGWHPWQTWEHQRWVQRWWLSWHHPSSEPVSCIKISINLYCCFVNCRSHITCHDVKRQFHLFKSKGQDWVHTEAFSMVVNTPVDSTTYSAPASPHLMLVGSLLKKTEMLSCYFLNSSFCWCLWYCDETEQCLLH